MKFRAKALTMAATVVTAVALQQSAARGKESGCPHSVPAVRPPSSPR
ncbi:hypothetical protein ACWEWG_31055 [Streptomyces sp. NPDC003758]